MPTILVVDDDAVARVVLRVMLDRTGSEIIEADSAIAAQEILAAGQHCDLVICDYAMPGANGLDLLEACPELHGKFVLLTGTKEREDLGDDRVENVSAYLTKPVGSEELNELINTMLGETQSASS